MNIIRKSTSNDLEQINELYNRIIDNMHKNNICIWDEYYPYEVFKIDIEFERQYVYLIDNKIVGAFSLCESDNGEKDIIWKDNNAKALYLTRIGVDTDYLNQGIGTKLLNNAIKITRDNGYKYLRLFVVECNMPAINLYKKNNFIQAKGIHKIGMNEDDKLIEYGFEIEL